MSVSAGETWSGAGLKFHGLSLSGVRTAIAIPELSMAFDVAQGYPFLLNLKNFFISHGHLDHAAGIPYILSQKAMTRQPRAKFYMPPSLVEPMTRIMRVWEEIERHQYDFDFIATNPDDSIPLADRHFVKVFPTLHRIDSNGYTLFESKKKLAPEYRNLSREQISEIARQGTEVTKTEETPLVSFTGDTQIEFLESRPWIVKSKVLMMECTYLDERKSVANAREWGHLHLDELIPLLPKIESEKIVLIHLSSRYSTREAQSILDSRLPAHERGRIEIYPGR
ncbi:MAG: MBL fold metallo-hydrolase [Bdellovibrionaceae bacterium]|nr:MBL fold metallo-hydrolase [Pseudobdellovibrionaceae bacterium]